MAASVLLQQSSHRGPTRICLRALPRPILFTKTHKVWPPSQRGSAHVTLVSPVCRGSVRTQICWTGCSFCHCLNERELLFINGNTEPWSIVRPHFAVSE